MSKQKTAILYERLSKDDELQGPSNSILNQRAMLEEYAERNGLAPYTHIQDDGYSGVTFDRPGWQEVMSKVEADEVSAIIVKTLDRMGRNYLQMGLLREVLQERGVRLIAISDGIDTSLGEDDFTPFREILSEWYARDTSKKIKAAVRSKGNSGKPLSSKPPYGYVKDPNDKNKWLIDPEAAEVVRRIFNYTIEGKSAVEICRILRDEKVERPMYHSAKRGYVNRPSALETEDPYLWRGSFIRTTLAKQEYIGSIVNFRQSKPSYKSKKLVKNPQEEWQVFEGAHEPIVDRETWELAQRVSQTVKRTDTTGEASPLTGLVFCSDCGSKMYNHRAKTDYYSCPNYYLGRQAMKENHCSQHYVNTELVRDILLQVIKSTAGYVREHEKEFAEKISGAYAQKRGEDTKSFERQIAKNGRRISELDKLFTSLYEDKVGGAISAERFAQMSGGYEREQASLKEENERLETELAAFKNDGARADNFLAIVRRYTQIEELTPAMIYEFVDRIIVHEAVWSEQDEGKGNGRRRKGERSQKIDIFLRYIGKFSAPDERPADEIAAERLAEEKLEKKRAYGREVMRRFNERKRAAKAKEKQ
jgi:DNA invertase Pin-like site-specific DNA recombinase